MIFSEKEQKDIDIKLGDVKLPRVKSTKFLGMWIDQNLNWNEHLSKLKSKIKKNLTILQISKKYLNCQTKKILYYAQIYSHLSYGLLLWGNMISNTQLNTMQKLQNKAIKLVDLKHSSIEKVYKNLEVLKIREALMIENCKMPYKLEYNKLSGKLSLLFNTNSIGRSLKRSTNTIPGQRIFLTYPRYIPNNTGIVSFATVLLTIKQYLLNLDN